MTPDRKCIVQGQLIEEYYWAGKLVVYIDHHAFEGTYSEARDKVAAAKAEKGK